MTLSGILLLGGFVLFAALMVMRVLPTLLALPIMAGWIAFIAGVPFFDWLSEIMVKGSFRLSAPIVLVVFGAMFARVIQKTGISDAIIKKAAELSGASKRYIMFRHILPGVSHLVVMSTALTCAGIMIAEAGLSFLGLGNPTAISWGKMLADAQSGGSMLFGQWWTILAPGIGIFLSVFSFMRIGLAVEGILNPRMKGQSGARKLLKHMHHRYLDEVLASMEDGK